MTAFDYEAIARRLVNLEQRLAAFSRTRQLGSSSVTLVDGSEVPLSDGLSAGADAALTIPTIEDALADVDEISDAVIDHNVAVPDWLENSGQNIAWESSQFAVELAEELGLNVADLSTDVSEAVSVANTAQGTADAAQLSAEAAKAEASIKAAEAQSAAEAFAAAEAEAAKLAAVAAASDDASDKAAAAEAAAKVAAAADATAKADAAEAAAKAVASAAQVTADQARTDAAAAHQAAGEAGSLASQAQATASGKSRIYRSTDAPSGVGTATGDKWERYDTLSAGGKLVATWAWSGQAWISTGVSETYLPLVDIGSGTYGTLTGNRLAANAIDGMTVTGAVLRTAPSGQRMQFDVNGLSAFDAFGRSTSSLFSDGRGMQLAGAKGRISFSPGVMSGSQIMMESDPDEVEDAWDSGRIYLGSATGVYQGERVRSIGLDLAAGIPFGGNYPAGTPRYEVSIMRSKTGKTYGFTDIANIDEFVYTAGSKTPGENSEVSAQIKSLALGIRNLGEARLRLTPGLTKSTISVGREGSYGGELELSAHTVSLDADEVRYRGDHDWFNLSYTPGHQAGTAAQAQVCRVGGIVYYRGGAHKFTGTFTDGETWIVAEGGIPEWARPTQNVRFGGGASGRRPAYLLITSAGAVIACPDPGNSMPSWISGATSYPQ